MPITYKILAQGVPATPGTTLKLYTVAALTSAVISTIVVCNQASTSATFRVAVSFTNLEVDSTLQYLYYDVVIPGNDTFAATIGITLAAGQQVRVTGSAVTLSFNLFGSEIT